MDRIDQNYRNYGNNIPITMYRVMKAFRVEEMLRGFIIYRVIHKSLRNFRTRLRNNQERHGIKEHINR